MVQDCQSLSAFQYKHSIVNNVRLAVRIRVCCCTAVQILYSLDLRRLNTGAGGMMLSLSATVLDEDDASRQCVGLIGRSVFFSRDVWIDALQGMPLFRESFVMKL